MNLRRPYYLLLNLFFVAMFAAFLVNGHETLGWRYVDVALVVWNTAAVVNELNS